MFIPDRPENSAFYSESSIFPDFRHFADGYVVTTRDVEAELQRIGHAFK